MSENVKAQKALLVGFATDNADLPATLRALDELSRLLSTAGGQTFAKITQVRSTRDPRTYIGSGKVQEIAELCHKNDLSLVVFDCELSPSQIRNLEEDIGGDVEVIDRSMLILDIFALHATTGEGKLQVELAQLKYTAPRLIGKGAELSRLGGTIGTRGPGESKLETDRRHLHRRIHALEEQIAEIESRVNEVIAQHLPVTVEFVTRDNVPQGVDLGKLPADASETLRIVRVGDYDICACIGAHVDNTSEIGTFRIISHSFENGTLRLRFRLA